MTATDVKPSKDVVDTKQKTTAPKMKLRDRWNNFRSNITVEPMLALYVMPSVLASLATQNLNLEKACRVNLAYSGDVCDALAARQTSNLTTEETEVQTLVAGMAAWKAVIQGALPALLLPLCGAWSDRHLRRKPCMLMPLTGELLCCIGLILCTYFAWWPMEVAGFVEGFFPAITGGWFTMFMAAFSYVADVTTIETRTLRIGAVNIFVSLGVPVGMALSGILYRQIGFYGVFCLSGCMYIISLYYGMFFLKEPKNKDAKAVTNGGACYAVKDFFDVSAVMETFRVTFRKGKGRRRIRVALLMVACTVIIGPMHGEMAVMYLFTRYRFNWNEVDFSVFSTYSMVTNLIGTALSVGILSHRLKIDDTLIGVLSCLSKILSCFVYAFATTTWVLYLAPIAEILNGTSFIAMRSIVSKLVPTDELGKVNSVFGICEAITPLIYGPMYSRLYAATLEQLPGAFFLLGGALTAPAVAIFLWMYHIQNQEDNKADDDQPEDGDREMKPAIQSKQNDVESVAPTGQVNKGFESDGTAEV